ncbi:MAG TPA: large conductance mechanosensitive channel protein MscL [Saprospiraceae bacterium]|jgi:large conductance mechanosensitive channel|nr:large conductance mechanosensitive channel protein MscL [Saprospiraceae bacterium]
MGMYKEFRTFIMKGNVIDLAIAVIFAGAFGAIINSLVGDIITPLLLAPALKAAGMDDIAALSWNGVKYGKFLSTVITFIVIAFVLFLVVKAYNGMKKKDESAAPPGPSQEQLLAEIRDLLKK